MDEFIEKNRRLLHFYCETLRTIGSVILILQLLVVCAMTIFALLSKFGYWPAPYWPAHKTFNMFIIAWLPSYLKAIVFWIGILGLAQFIKYLFERNYKPGWILRHGDMFFYLYALLTILEAVWIYMTNYHSPSSDIRVDMGFVTVFSIVVKVMALVGLGRILRHLMPVIEESKTLV
jgi:hypothetical protein